MLSIKTKETKQSSVCGGVSFTIRRLSKIQRSKRDLQIFEHRLKFSALLEDYNRIAKEKGLKPGDAPDAELAALDYEAGLIMNLHIKPAAILAGLVEVSGIEIDGVPVTPQTLLDSGPELNDLIDEIYGECEFAAGLTGEQQKNSQSPTISLEQVAGEIDSSTAVRASA